MGVRLSQALKIPFIFTGHSLGREKKRKLLEAGLKINQIEKLYCISKRINAEAVSYTHLTLPTILLV